MIIQNKNLSEQIYENLKNNILKNKLELGAKISVGEHGIGLKRKGYLNLFCSEAEIALMRKIKTVIDPRNIMNPGKIFK